MFRRNWLMAALSFATVGLFGKKAEAGNSITFRNGSTMHFSGEDVALRGVDTVVADTKPEWHSVIRPDTLICLVDGGATLSNQRMTSMRPVIGSWLDENAPPKDPWLVIEQEVEEPPQDRELGYQQFAIRARRFRVMGIEVVGTVDQLVADYKSRLLRALASISCDQQIETHEMSRIALGFSEETQQHLRELREKYPPNESGVSIIPWDHNGRCAELAARREAYNKEEAVQPPSCKEE